MYIYMYMMDFYSTVKKNMIMKFGRKWMDLEKITGSIVVHAQNVHHHVLSDLQSLASNVYLYELESVSRKG